MLIDLNGEWQLTYSEGCNRQRTEQFAQEQPAPRRQIPALVPGTVQQALLDDGWFGDPRVGTNSLQTRWVEQADWVYRREFQVRLGDQAVSGAEETRWWLRFERIDYEATIFLNGRKIGRHLNANRPARFEVTQALREGPNTLVVVVSAGVVMNADKPARPFDFARSTPVDKCVLRRSPVFQGGWDWSPRFLNVGLLGNVSLLGAHRPFIVQSSACSVVSEDLQSAHVRVRVWTVNPSEKEAEVELTVSLGAFLGGAGRSPEEPALPNESRSSVFPPGESERELVLKINKPRLWWPHGHGSQELFSLRISLAGKPEDHGEDVSNGLQSLEKTIAFRRVEIDQSPHPEEGTHFILKINNRPIFCKGANWVPPDIMYSHPDLPARERELAGLALEANFNLLRIWGGGTWASETLLGECDRRGILVWHDFLFACAKYPAADPEYLREVRAEATWAVREMAHHPSLIVWCGSNEVEQGDWEWGYDNAYEAHPHYVVFHHDLPKIVLENNPSVPYWPSSPFSPGYKLPNDPTVGDQHPWKVTLGQDGPIDWRAYRQMVDRFPNEGGVLGASTPATFRDFLPEGQNELLSPSWDHHDNVFAMVWCMADHGWGKEGKPYATVRHWTGRDPFAMSVDEYAFVSGFLQAQGLVEYILNFRRRMFSSASAVYWMFNESWPTTHSWTILDFYRRRKLAFHPVRRAFQPVTVVVAEEDDQIRVFGVNDNPNDWHGEVRFGLCTLDGDRVIEHQNEVRLPANASTPLGEFARREWERLGLNRAAAYGVLFYQDRVHAQHVLFTELYKDLQLAAPNISLKLENGLVTFESNVPVFGACLDIDGEAPYPDNCFDLLPGVPYSIPWELAWGEPKVLKTGNTDLLASEGAKA